MNKILPVILFVAIGGFFYTTLSKVNKSSANNTKRIECQTKSVTVEKVFVHNPVMEAVSLLESNNYVIQSKIEYSKYMPSNLVYSLTKEQADKKLENVISTFVKKNNPSEHKVLINYSIYENDKKENGKTSTEENDYSGHLVFEFKLDDKPVYKIKTNYLDNGASDLKQRLTCVVDSFVSLK